jgi:hypothetical protein
MMDYGPSADPTIDALELSTVLARLGLSQCEERLRENGFDDWENLTRITETDMAELGFKLGDRRKLQRAIRENSSSSASRVEHEAKNISLLSERIPDIGERSAVTPRGSQQVARTTRQYRRHPRPDSTGPNKPRTAYVLFGEHVRQDLVLSSLSFSEIAKETGKRWRELSDRERANMWETPAADRLQGYKEEFELYKQTENYQSYQTYLKNFKQGQHNPDSITPSDMNAESTSKSASFSQLPASQDQETFEAIHQDSFDTEDVNMEGQSQDTTSPVESGMEEVRHISKALGINPHLMRVTAFPPEDITTKAVEAFLHGTGSLLYLWNQDEALNLVSSVYHPQTDSTPVHTIEVFAMSAVGSYCDGEAHTKLLQEKFLHFFLNMLSSASDMCDLRCMRLFACLATCRFTNSVESARKLMCKRLILFEFRHNGLTARSISAQHWKADINVSFVWSRKPRRKNPLLAECISKRRLPRKVCALNILLWLFLDH